MKTPRFILFVFVGGLAFVAGFEVGKDRRPSTLATTEERETIRDTIPYHAPTLKSELAVGARAYTLPSYRFPGGRAEGEIIQPREVGAKIASPDTTICLSYGTGAGGEPRCSTDSATVEQPVIQRHYADSTY